jgi:membrane protease YdiL (CAAX protease family)
MSDGNAPTPQLLPRPLPAARTLPVSGADLLLVLIVALGSVRLLAGLIVAFAPHGGGGAGLPLTLGVLLFQTLAILLAIRSLVLRNYGLRWADLGLRPTTLQWHRRGLVLAVLLLPTVAAINGILIPQISGEEFHNPQLTAVAPDGFSWPALLAMLFMAGFVAPLGEELAFRGLLFPWLRDRLGVFGAAVVSGLIFAILHGVPMLIPALTAIGTALALLYHRCGSLWPVILAHGVFNGIMVIALYAALAAGRALP